MVVLVHRCCQPKHHPTSSRTGLLDLLPATIFIPSSYALFLKSCCVLTCSARIVDIRLEQPKPETPFSRPCGRPATHRPRQSIFGVAVPSIFRAPYITCLRFYLGSVWCYRHLLLFSRNTTSRGSWNRSTLSSTPSLPAPRRRLSLPPSNSLSRTTTIYTAASGETTASRHQHANPMPLTSLRQLRRWRYFTSVWVPS